MPHFLTTSTGETIGEETGNYYLSFTMFLPGLLRLYTLQHTREHRRDGLLFKSMIDLLLSVYCIWLEAGGYFLMDNFSIL